MRTVLAPVLLAAGVLLAGCGSEGGAGDDGAARVVVTTSILGDVVRSIVGDAATVDVLMEPGVDPHDAAPSARQVADLREADVIIVNGLGLEAALEDTLESAVDDGIPLVVATDGVDIVPFAEHGTGEHEEGHAHEEGDPHFFTDPQRMADAVEHIAAELERIVPALAGPAFDERVADYLEQLDQLDADLASAFAAIPADRRILVTNHEVLGYLADRYGFELLGAVIPGGSTLAQPAAADLEHLAEQIAAAGVPAIFTETSSPARLAQALATEGTDVEVVELHTESLGEPGSDAATYLQLMRTNAERIVAALAPEAG